MGKKGSIAFLLFLILSLLLVPLSLSKSEDAQAMSDMAKSLKNLPSSWLPNSDPCSPGWSGVRCNSANRVSDINLARMSISGSLPASLSTLTSLTSLQLQSNSISGPVPSLSSLTSLTRLTLDDNSFSSLPPDFPSGLTSLESLSIDDNPFAPWTIPDTLTPSSSISTLTSFSASNCSLSGIFPEILATLPNLQTLRLSYNNLTGSLPDSLIGSSIQSLQLNNQQSNTKFTGGIDVIGSMPQLTLIWFQSNGFTGPIPDLSNLTSLQSFNVRDNQLTGVIPPSLTSLTTLQNVSLSNNMFQGPIPSFSSKVTADVATGNNYCNPSSGPCDPRVTILLAVASGFNYPSSFSNSWKGNDPCGSSWVGVTCDSSGKDITILNFANQKLTGVISPAVANITTLTKLMLSNNNLTGTIPDDLTKMPNLQLLDVSNNGLTGEVPKFASTVTLKVSGNRFGQTGSGSESNGSSDGSGSDGSSSPGDQFSVSNSSSLVKIVVPVIVVIILLGVIIFGFIWYKKRKSMKNFVPVKLETSNYGTSSNTNGYQNNGYQSNGLSELYTQASTSSPNKGMHMSMETLIEATDNFSKQNILGQGGFGTVYKGNLNGTLIAVKKSQSDPMGQKGHQEFRAEIDVLTKVRHRNLVALLGYCENGSEKLLIYAYMQGGTLGQHLFDLSASGARHLSWSQRVIIALDVARGIEYLHSLAQETFIHRDLKPSNILLDGEMRAKVSDFGLVKLAADREKSYMTRLAGTFGYLAPEYATTGKVSTKVDLYAFGVILMEIISGRKVIDDDLPEDERHLVAFFRRSLLDRDRFIKTMVDPNLTMLDPESRKAVLEMADLAKQCTAREPVQRPDMSHCVNRLSLLVDQWRPGTYEDGEDDEGDLEEGFGLGAKLEMWKNGKDGESSSYLGSTYG